MVVVNDIAKRTCAIATCDSELVRAYIRSGVNADANTIIIIVCSNIWVGVVVLRVEVDCADHICGCGDFDKIIVFGQIGEEVIAACVSLHAASCIICGI